MIFRMHVMNTRQSLANYIFSKKYFKNALMKYLFIFTKIGRNTKSIRKRFSSTNIQSTSEKAFQVQYTYLIKVFQIQNTIRKVQYSEVFCNWNKLLKAFWVWNEIYIWKYFVSLYWFDFWNYFVFEKLL